MAATTTMRATTAAVVVIVVVVIVVVVVIIIVGIGFSIEKQGAVVVVIIIVAVVQVTVIVVVIVAVAVAVGVGSCSNLLSVNGSVLYFLIVERIFSESSNDLGVQVRRWKIGGRIFLQGGEGPFECAHNEVVPVKDCMRLLLEKKRKEKKINQRSVWRKWQREREREKRLLLLLRLLLLYLV